MNIRDQVAIIQRERSQQFIRPYFPTIPQAMRRVLISGANNKALGYGGLTGAKYTSTAITTAAPLSTAYNPSAPVAITDDGIAYGVDLDNANAPCLIFNAPVTTSTGATFGNILSFDLPQTCLFLVWRTANVPVAGNTSVVAYEAYWA